MSDFNTSFAKRHFPEIVDNFLKTSCEYEPELPNLSDRKLQLKNKISSVKFEFLKRIKTETLPENLPAKTLKRKRDLEQMQENLLAVQNIGKTRSKTKRLSLEQNPVKPPAQAPNATLHSDNSKNMQSASIQQENLTKLSHNFQKQCVNKKLKLEIFSQILNDFLNKNYNNFLTTVDDKFIFEFLVWLVGIKYVLG